MISSTDSTSIRRQVRKVLLDLGIREPLAHDRYLANLTRRFPQQAAVFLEVHDRLAADGGPTVGLYAAKNADLDFSLAITSQEFRPIHEEFLCWLLQSTPKPPRRVLDLGCESGVLTLALAKIWPGTDFVGIDRQEEAIRVSRQLADRQGVENATFVVDDLGGLDASSLGTFDLVLAVALFHELMRGSESAAAPPDSDGFSLDATPEWDHGMEDMLSRIGGLVGQDGTMMSLNRWAHPDRTLQWARAMDASGFRTDFTRSEVLQVGGRNRELELLPVTVHSRGSRHPGEDLIDGVLSIHAGPDLCRSDQPLALEGPAGEALRRAITGAERVFGYDLEHLNGSGTERVEVLLAGALSLFYHTSTRGMRRLEIGTLKMAREFSVRVSDHKLSKEGWVEARALPVEREIQLPAVDRSGQDPMGILRSERAE